MSAKDRAAHDAADVAVVDVALAQLPSPKAYKGRFTWTVMVAILIGACAGAVFG